MEDLFQSQPALPVLKVNRPPATVLGKDRPVCPPSDPGPAGSEGDSRRGRTEAARNSEEFEQERKRRGFSLLFHSYV